MSELTLHEAWSKIALVLAGSPQNTVNTYRYWWGVFEECLAQHDAPRNRAGDILLPLDPLALIEFEAWLRQPTRQGGESRYASMSVAGATGAIKGCYNRLLRAKIIEGPSPAAGVGLFAAADAVAAATGARDERAAVHRHGEVRVCAEQTAFLRNAHHPLQDGLPVREGILGGWRRRRSRTRPTVPERRGGAFFPFLTPLGRCSERMTTEWLGSVPEMRRCTS